MSRTFRNQSYRDRSDLEEKKELERTIQRVELEEQLIESEEIEETEIGFPEDWVDSYNEVSKN